MADIPAPLQRLLAATDFSAPATLALERAARLSREHGAALVLTHVLSKGWLDELQHLLSGGGHWAARLHEDAQRSLSQLAQPLNASTRTELLDGEPVPALCEAVERSGAELLVIGARGDNPLHQRLLGGTAERLLRKCRAALLVVRQRSDGPYRCVLVPVDFSPWSLHAVRLVQRITPDAQLVLHHSFTIPFESKLRFAGVADELLGDYREQARASGRAALLSLARDAGLPEDSYRLSLSEGDAPQRILDAAEAHGCDLIAIGKHGRQAAEELLLGSVTRHVLEEAVTDVLVSTAHTFP